MAHGGGSKRRSISFAPHGRCYRIIYDKTGWIRVPGRYPPQMRKDSLTCLPGEGPVAGTSAREALGGGQWDSLWGDLRKQSLFCPRSDWV